MGVSLLALAMAAAALGTSIFFAVRSTSIKDGEVGPKGDVGQTGATGTCACDKAETFLAAMPFNASDFLSFSNPGVDTFVQVTGTTPGGRSIEEDTTVTVGDIHWDSALDQINVTDGGILTIKAAFTWQQTDGGFDNFGFGIQVNTNPIEEYTAQQSAFGVDWNTNSYSASIILLPPNAKIRFYIKDTTDGVSDWIVGGVRIIMIEHI